MNAPTFRQLCVVVHHVSDYLKPDTEPSRVIDEVKWQLSKSNLTIPLPHHLTAAVEAVRVARAKGYRTPRRRRRAQS